MSQPTANLRTFLFKHKTTEGMSATHTGMYFPWIGKYSIPDEKIDEFWDLYNNYFNYCTSNSRPLNLAILEKPLDISPILIDIDIKQNDIHRIYTQNDVINIVKKYKKAICEILDNSETIIMDAFVFEKPSPRECDDKHKDGFHIIFNDIYVTKQTHIKIHEHVLNQCKNEFPKSLKHLGDEKDIIDLAVTRNNWIIYGGHKKNECIGYQYTYKVSDNNVIINNTNEIDPRYFSIRKIASIVYKEKIGTTHSTESIESNKLHHEPTNTKHVDNIETIMKLLNMLSISRCDDEKSWIDVGFVLHNINTSLLSVWKEWSKQSPKYQESECDKRWKRFKNDGMNIGSLYMWAKQDNPEKFEEFKNSHHKELLITATLTHSHYDVSKVLYNKYKNLYVCASIKKSNWYVFENHKWKQMEEGYMLLNKMSTDLSNELSNLANEFARQNLELDEPDKEITKKQNNCKILLVSLKDHSFKTKVLKECAIMFYDPYFINNLDSNTHLIGFENGIYDISTLTFRDGRPEDYVSFSTQIMYIEFDENDPVVLEIKHFVNCVVPNPDLQKYIMQLLASYLEGSTRDQKFHIWTGSGANGKSTLIELFEMSFGEYCCKLPISLLTKKRNSSNSASPEVQNAKGKRFASLQEPDDGDLINVGYMKELSGGDKIYSRGLYSNPQEFKPQFKMLLTCNKLPEVPARDDGTWRRLRVCEFSSKFVDYEPTNDNEYRKDTTIGERMFDWKEAFMWILIQNLILYKKFGLVEPEIVLRHTNMFKAKNDKMIQYFEDNIEKTNEINDMIQIKRFYDHFKNWYKDIHNSVPPPYKEFKEYLEHMDKYTKNSRGVYIGIKFVENDLTF